MPSIPSPLHRSGSLMSERREHKGDCVFFKLRSVNKRGLLYCLSANDMVSK